MAKFDTIVDYEEWLQRLNTKQALLLTTRVALRTLPLSWICEAPDASIDALALCGVRNGLTAWVAATDSKTDDNDIKDFAALLTSASEMHWTNIGGASRVEAVRAALSAPAEIAHGVKISATALRHSIASVEEHGRTAQHQILNQAYADTEHLFTRPLDRPLWDTFHPPSWAKTKTYNTKVRLSDEPEWSFWVRWHEGLERSTPFPRQMLEQIIKIDAKHWMNAQTLAREIQRVEDEFSSTKADDQQTHVKELLSNVLKTELQARGLQNLIQMAIDAYRREISNALPDELEPLEQLPTILDQIALVLSGDVAASEKEEQLYGLIQDMARTINELNRRLEGAHAARVAAEGKIAAQSAGRLFSEAFYTNAGAGFGKMISSKVLWGGVIAGGAMIMGVGSEAATDKLAWLCNEVILPEGPDAPLLPPSPDGGAKFVKPPVK